MTEVKTFDLILSSETHCWQYLYTHSKDIEKSAKKLRLKLIELLLLFNSAYLQTIMEITSSAINLLYHSYLLHLHLSPSLSNYPLRASGAALKINLHTLTYMLFVWRHESHIKQHTYNYNNNNNNEKVACNKMSNNKNNNINTFTVIALRRAAF